MILSSQSLRRRLQEGMIQPWADRTNDGTLTFGLGPAGYDIRLAQRVHVGSGFALASSMEHFVMPDDLLAQVCDKSTWARRGLFVQNTIIEPGWRGYLTLELTYHGEDVYRVIPAGTPIAQVVFMQLDEPTDAPYGGKYQDQESGPQEAR